MLYVFKNINIYICITHDSISLRRLGGGGAWHNMKGGIEAKRATLKAAINSFSRENTFITILSPLLPGTRSIIIKNRYRIPAHGWKYIAPVAGERTTFDCESSSGWVTVFMIILCSDSATNAFWSFYTNYKIVGQVDYANNTSPIDSERAWCTWANALANVIIVDPRDRWIDRVDGDDEIGLCEWCFECKVVWKKK